jgi:radical SAM protein (TIGR04043 family)
VNEPTDVRTILTELQSLGLRWTDPRSRDSGLSRVGGAGPSDHKAVTLEGQTIMVPIHTLPAAASPYRAVVEPNGRHARLFRDEMPVGTLSFPRKPRFYDLETEDGIPYWKIATLHSSDVLATTILQTCVRFRRRDTSCQFCAIEQSLASGKTIDRKTPAQLAEVARAAVELDGVTHMVMTTGTPPGLDRGAEILCESARGVKAVVDLPLQGQCEPPADDFWFARMAESGIESLGMHLEAVNDEVRKCIMPGKAEVSLSHYLRAFEAAVAVFGRGQVSTYILAGLGDTEDEIVKMASRLAGMGVYPFVVPFVPISGTPLAHRAPPSIALMRRLYERLESLLAAAGLRAGDIKAGCGRCGACSALKAFEPVAEAGS